MHTAENRVKWFTFFRQHEKSQQQKNRRSKFIAWLNWLSWLALSCAIGFVLVFSKKKKKLRKKITVLSVSVLYA